MTYADPVPVPLELVERAIEALGCFVSDQGWEDTDMQTMDDLIATLEQNRKPS